MEKIEISPTTSSSIRRTFSTSPTEKLEESAPLLAGNETSDSNRPEEDYESVDLRGNTELDEEWVEVGYPAGSNGWWRTRQRAKGCSNKLLS